MDCLAASIGITRTPCECLAGELPPDYMVSDSGLYMDELPESPISLKSVKSIADCGKDMAFLLTNARNQAIAEFRRAFFKHLQSMFTSSMKPYSGVIGSYHYNGVIPLSGGYAGVLLEGVKISGASIILKRVITVFDTTATFDLMIIKAYQGDPGYELIATKPVQSIAGGTKENILPQPIDLPLIDATEKRINYYFLYQPSGFNPKNNNVSCNCGQKEIDLRAYVIPKGVTGTDLNSLSTFQTSQYVNGLLLDIEARCGGEGIICEAYQDDMLRQVIAMAILYKAVEILIWGILNSNEINRDTMARREQMEAGAYRLSGKFKNDVQWLAENINLSDSDCFTCKHTNDLYYKTGIMA